MKELIDTFLNYLSVERGLSQNTIVSYRRDLVSYLDFISSRNVDSLAKIAKSDITNFMMNQKDRGIAANSIARRLAAIRMFHLYSCRAFFSDIPFHPMSETDGLSPFEQWFPGGS